ncbi:hypothetical protein A3K64_02140 [Candidatus Micrarchaeota archaeon RBG_16_36_9]|nr:MAG: hypothetical protein A3K64_02140 [Candidatus Micrarchaeota archaeon RBG_16_36_9]
MKGIIFTLDAIVAFGIIVAIISGLVYFRIDIVSPYLSAQRLHLMSEDILSILSNSKLGEIANETLLNQYIADGTLEESDLSKKTMDVIGALWSAGKREEAANITNDILGNFIPNNTGYQIMINADDFYNSSGTSRPEYDDASIRISSGRIISGYEKYKPVSGYVARAWATKIKRTMIKAIPINLAWGSYTENLGAQNRFWYNGYAPDATVANRWAIIQKNFTIPSDANISYAYMQMAFDTDYANITINGNSFWNGSALAGVIRDNFNITNYITPGSNTVNIDFRRVNLDLGHFHPGSYIKIKYNTSEAESGSNETVFSADFIRGAPSANEIIPFFVNAQIRNVTAFVDVRDINAFLLLTLNYRYNASNPMQNVLLYREYPPSTNCSIFSIQATCQSNPDCSWNPTAPSNKTVFYDDFETDITTNWTVSSNWARETDQEHSGAYSAKKSANSGSGNLTSKSANTSDTTDVYIDLWYRDDDTDASEVTLEFNDSSGHWDSIAGLSSSTEDSWNNYVSRITDSQYFHPGFNVRFRGSSLGSGENFWIDDVNIMKTVNGKCENTGGEEVMNRSYELFFNDTGTLINEYNTGSLLNTWFNTNVTINNIFNNMTNTLGIYADIRKPENLSVVGTPDRDWQRLGMFANNDTAGHPNDYYCYITDKSNVTVYHDVERYGLEYGKIDISAVENFTTVEKNCITKNNVNSCKDAFLNLTFSFPTTVLSTKILGTQSWGGNDNGYNFIWAWENQTEPVEHNLVMDTDTPPGTFAYIPVQFLHTNKMNTIRVGDKDGGRYLNTEPNSLMGNRRSIVEYSFLIPSQVGYGDVFENQNDAISDAEGRLNDTLGSFASATVIEKDSFRVGGVPYMYGPFSFRVNVWV